MTSLRARLVDLALPLLGIKRFFSQPERMPGRIARMRTRKPIRPRAKWRRQYAFTEFSSRGFPVVTVTPHSGTVPGAPHLLYLHGGGYVMDIAAVHWEAILHLCDALGASATVPIYPLAPEHQATTTMAAMTALYEELAARHGASAITIMGDSAGGGMALALAQMLRDGKTKPPASLVLFSPWLDATGSGVGQAAIEKRDRMLAVNGLDACGRMYAGELPLDDPRVSPLYGPLEGLPPMAIFSGTSDILLVDGQRLADRLERPGMPAFEYHEYQGMFHVWMLLPVPEGRKALEQAARFIRAHRKEPA